MLTVMFTVVSGKMTKLKATERMITKMAQSIEASGLKTNSMAQVVKCGLMAPSIKVVTTMVKSMGKGPLFGLTALSMLESSTIITYMV